MYSAARGMPFTPTDISTALLQSRRGEKHAEALRAASGECEGEEGEVGEEGNGRKGRRMWTISDFAS